MKIHWLIIDGHNLLHKQPDLVLLMNKSQEQARSALLRLIEPIATHIAPKPPLSLTDKNAAATSLSAPNKLTFSMHPLDSPQTD